MKTESPKANAPGQGGASLNTNAINKAKSIKNPNSAGAQRERILHRLRELKSVTSVQMREQLDVLHPSGRVMELRKKGYDISTQWVRAMTACGVSHRVGLFELHSEPEE
jgi:Helix-turn-helix domain